MRASILINNYNYELYVDKAIKSALSQTFNEVEIILYDDGSTDNSLKIINNYSEKIIIISRDNYGKGHCWNQINAVNEAFKVSTGEVIFLMDSDDWFFANKVERVMEIFNKNTNIVCVQHKFQLVNEDNVDLNKEKRPFFSGINILEGIFFTKRLDFFFTQTSGLCFKRSFLQKILPMQEDELSKICIDVRLSRFTAFEGEVVSLQEKLAAYRVHTKNHSSILADRNYFDKFENQHQIFFNRLTKKYNYPTFKNGNRVISYLKVLILLMKAKMSISEKRYFSQAWYKSYINK